MDGEHIFNTCNVSVYIVGGGPTGLRTSKLLVERGYDVTIYESGEIGKPVRCGEAYLDIYPNVERPKHGCLFEHDEVVHTVGGEDIVMDGSHMYQYDRREMERGMADEAIDSGVVILEGERVSTPISDGVTIDASGYPSIMYRPNDYRKGFATSTRVDTEVDRMKFEWGKDGYYWEFPKGEESNVGYGEFQNYSFSEVKKKAIDRAREIGKVKEYGAGFIPTGLDKKLWIDNESIILVGDSAGLCNPFHGGGLQTALLSAKLAVECLDNKNLDSYRDKLMTMMRDERRSASISSMLRKSGYLKYLLRLREDIRGYTYGGISLGFRAFKKLILQGEKIWK